jgi:hypothetical protein
MWIGKSNAAFEEIIESVLFLFSGCIDYLIAPVSDFFDLIDQLLVDLHEARLYLCHFSEK